MSTSTTDPALLVGLDEPDDAAVYRITGEVALVQTVDFFTPIVDDPFDWGQIAAANALSDVYAMGGAPKTALNLVAWPRSLDLALLGRVLEGGESTCHEAGVTVVGGHSVDDPEPKFGLAVTGTVHPERVVRKSGARPGDSLILTKALGTGIISSAIKEGVAPKETVTAATASMKILNAAAAAAMVDVGVNAATDVTGFGLIGHLRQMLGSELDAHLELAMIPIFPGAVDLAERGIIPGGSERNLEADIDNVELSDEVTDPRRAAIFDAQTSGGMLMAVPPDRQDDLLSALEARRVEPRAVIGSVGVGTGRVRVE